MADFRAPNGCTGFRMEDGTRYDSTRTGRVVVDNPNHVKAIERASRNGSGRIAHAVYGADPHTASRTCGGCGFVGYAWQTTCPRCGGPLDG